MVAAAAKAAAATSRAVTPRRAAQQPFASFQIQSLPQGIRSFDVRTGFFSAVWHRNGGPGWRAARIRRIPWDAYCQGILNNRARSVATIHWRSKQMCQLAIHPGSQFESVRSKVAPNASWSYARESGSSRRRRQLECHAERISYDFSQAASHSFIQSVSQSVSRCVWRKRSSSLTDHDTHTANSWKNNIWDEGEEEEDVTG